MKIWLSQVLQDIQAHQIYFEFDAKILDDTDTLDALESESPIIFVGLQENAVYSSIELHNQFDSDFFDVDYANFINHQSNGTQVCALHFLMWHRNCPRNFPSDYESYVQCIESVKNVHIAWGNSSPATWLHPALGPFELAKLFCKSFGSRLNQVTSFTMLDAGSLFRMLHRCTLFNDQVQGVSLEASRAILWAHRLWYNAWNSDKGRLTHDDFTRIMLILSDFFRNSEAAYKKFCELVAMPKFEFFDLLRDVCPDFATQSDQSGIQTERAFGDSQYGGSSVQSEAPDFGDIDHDTQFSRFCIVSPAHAATAQHPATAVKPFFPVVEIKAVKLNFTISLQNATLFFDGSKRPRGQSSDWKPHRAIVSWASWSKNEKNGKVTTSNASFCCKEAAIVGSAGAAASYLQVEWCDNTASAVGINKELKWKPGCAAFEELFIQITVFAANQGRRPTQTTDEFSKPIVLGAPFLVNLSVCWPI